LFDLPEKVTIVEVGPRDGLQNESTPIATPVKLAYIQKLVDAGLTQIEATSFVHPKAVPQLADAAEVARNLPRAVDVIFSALVPNLHGLKRAIESGFRRVAVFTAASDSFTQKNIGMSIEESLSVFAEVVREAIANGMTVRGYVSTAFVCPYEGLVSKDRVRELTDRLLQMGVDEVAVSDTIGAAAPKEVTETIAHLLRTVPRESIALHFHDTYGTALANVLVGLQMGITTFDSSTGGMGGCPFAPGAAGNLATEDLVYMLHRMDIQTGVNPDKLIEAGAVISQALGRPLRSAQWRMRNVTCAVNNGEYKTNISGA